MHTLFLHRLVFAVDGGDSDGVAGLSCYLLEKTVSEGSYLVDPASSHMLVSKIKPCMSKYNCLYCETANGSLNQL
jgi:hypothetical protein